MKIKKKKKKENKRRKDKTMNDLMKQGKDKDL